MAPASFFRLLTVFSLAVLNVSFNTLPANALAVEHGHMARNMNHAHAGVAKKRRDSSKQCKPRPVSSVSSSISPDVSPSPSISQHSSANVALAHPATPVSVSHSSSHTTTASSQSPTHYVAASGNSGGKVCLGWSNLEEGSMGNFITSKTN
jgi:hypothetical protein